MTENVLSKKLVIREGIYKIDKNVNTYPSVLSSNKLMAKKISGLILRTKHKNDSKNCVLMIA